MTSLSVCMIAKDEEAYIGDTIKSVKPIADEIIVVDTGSKDDTKKIAEKLGAKVVDFKWNDDFSEAHNEAVSHATKDWVLVLDADERISSLDYDRLKDLLGTDVDGYVLQQRTYSTKVETHKWRMVDGSYPEEEEFAGYFPSNLVRLFKNNKGYHFTNKNHDIVEPSIRAKEGTIKTSGIPIHHFAKTKGDSFFEKKIDHYLKMGLAHIKEEPDNPRPHYEVGLIYMAKNQLDKAKEEFKKVVKVKPEYKTTLAQLGIIELRSKNYQLAAQLFDESIQKKPEQDIAYLYLGELMLMIDKPQKAAKLFKVAAQKNPGNFKAYQKYATACLRQGKADTALKVMLKIHNKNKNIVDVYNMLGEIWVAKEKYENARQVLNNGIKIAEKQSNDPMKIVMMINIADVHHKMGDDAEAIKIYEEVLTLKPKHADVVKKRIKALKK